MFKLVGWFTEIQCNIFVFFFFVCHQNLQQNKISSICFFFFLLFKVGVVCPRCHLRCCSKWNTFVRCTTIGLWSHTGISCIECRPTRTNCRFPSIPYRLPFETSLHTNHCTSCEPCSSCASRTNCIQCTNSALVTNFTQWTMVGSSWMVEDAIVRNSLGLKKRKKADWDVRLNR